MNDFGLNERELELIRGILRQHPEVTRAQIFGSRAKGNYQPNSDVDIAVWGDIAPIELARIIGELEELPLPYRFDVTAYDRISHAPLREHIDRVGKAL